MDLKTVTLIGAGNIASSLGKALYDKGLKIDAVYSRKPSGLAALLGSKGIHDLSGIPAGSDLYLMAVSDRAIEEVASSLLAVEGMLVHTSGSTPLSALSRHARTGVFYPAQTFIKDTDPEFTGVPFLVEASRREDILLLKALAEMIGGAPHEATSDQRMHIHMAAVFANNFVNHLYHIASELIREQQLPPDILKPLIAKTAAAVAGHDASDVQTGPARRHDQPTIEKHLGLLSGHPLYREIYARFTASISELYK